MKKRYMPPLSIHHVYNRGVMKMNIFRDGKDYERFLRKLHEYNKNLGVGIVVFCLMPNHFHLLLQEPKMKMGEGNQGYVSGTIISRLMHLTLSSHAIYFGKKYHHSGVVFQSRFKNRIITDMEYFYTVVEYILNNPVRKGFVRSYRDWKYCGKNQKLLNEIISK